MKVPINPKPIHVKTWPLEHRVTIEGEVDYTHPHAKIDVDVTFEGQLAKRGFEKQRYFFEVGPGNLINEQTRKFSILNLPFKVRLEVKPIEALIIITVSAPKFGAIYTHTEPYKKHKGPHTIKAFGLYAVLEELEGKADHTYVSGKDQPTGYEYLWPCGGAYEGGRELTTGECDGNISDCISQRAIDIRPAGGMAGMRYGIDGVCHQAANRIMFPAGLIVDQAFGWSLSFFLYGAYGLSAIDTKGAYKFFEILETCYPNWRDDPHPYLGSETNKDIIYKNEITTYRELWDELSDGEISTTQADDLLTQREEIRSVRNELIELYENDQESGDKAAEKLNGAVYKCMGQNEKILSGGIYQKIFKMPIGFRTLIMDPQIAAWAFAAK